MKKSTLALVVMGIVASSAVQAAKVYNKNGNKLGLKNDDVVAVGPTNQF